MQPPGSLPGMSNLAIAPARPPMMIQTIQLFDSRRPITHLPFVGIRELGGARAVMNTNDAPQGKCHR